MKDYRWFPLFILISIALSGCQTPIGNKATSTSEGTTPENIVAQFLDAIQAEDQTLFTQIVEPGSRKANLLEFTEGYFGDAIEFLGVQLADIAFHDLTYVTINQDGNTATVRVRGYMLNQRTGEELSFDKNINTRLSDGTWIVSPGHFIRPQLLIFLPHDIQKAPSPVQGKTRWIFIGSIQNIGNENFIGDWPEEGVVSTQSNEDNQARVEFVCPENFTLESPYIPILSLPPQSFTRGVFGCELAVSVEIDWDQTPQILSMANFKNSDLTSKKPVPTEQHIPIQDPDTIEIPGGPEYVYNGISTQSRMDGNKYILDLVIYITLNYQSQPERIDLHNPIVSIKSSEGHVVKLDLTDCGEYPGTGSQSGTKYSFNRKFCVPLTENFFRFLQKDQGYTLYVYIPEGEIFRTYWMDVSPKYLISEEPILYSPKLVVGNKIYPDLHSNSLINWYTAQSLILSGYCTTIRLINDAQIRIELNDDRFFLTPKIELDTLRSMISYCGQSCANIKIIYETVSTPLTSPAKRTPTPQKNVISSSTVLWDVSHGPREGQVDTYDTEGMFNNLKSLLGREGIHLLDNRTSLAAVNLTDYSVVVLCMTSAVEGDYTTNEAQKILQFVNEGGSLLVLAEKPEWPNSMKAVLDEFGIIPNLSPYIDKVDVGGTHPIFSGVNEVKYYYNGGGLRVNNPDAKILASAGAPTIVEIENLPGKLLIIGDSNLFDNRGLVHNERFARNVFSWLVDVQSRSPSEIRPHAVGDGEIGPQAVWEGDLGSCLNSDNHSWDCIISLMTQRGANSEAIDFVSKYRAILISFHEKGKVDIGTIFDPFRAHDNVEAVLLNGTNPLIYASSVGNINISDHPSFTSLVRKYPNVILWATDHSLDSVKTMASGGQRFVFRYLLYNGCHACGIAGYADISFDFDALGNLLETKLISLSSP